MRTPLAIIAVFLLLPVTTANWSNSACGFPASTQTKPSQSMSLSLTMLRQRYCEGDEDIDGVNLRARMSFTNTGTEPVVFYIGGTRIVRVTVAASAADLDAGKFEANSTLTTVTSGSGGCLDGDNPGKCFVNLAPGESYSVEANTGTYVVRKDGEVIDGAVAPGEHVLRVQVSTWLEPYDQGLKFRRELSPRGFLWLDSLYSIPVPFTIDRERHVERCWE